MYVLLSVLDFVGGLNQIVIYIWRQWQEQRGGEREREKKNLKGSLVWANVDMIVDERVWWVRKVVLDCELQGLPQSSHIFAPLLKFLLNCATTFKVCMSILLYCGIIFNHGPTHSKLVELRYKLKEIVCIVKEEVQ